MENRELNKDLYPRLSDELGPVEASVQLCWLLDTCYVTPYFFVLLVSRNETVEIGVHFDQI